MVTCFNDSLTPHSTIILPIIWQVHDFVSWGNFFIFILTVKFNMNCESTSF